MSEDDKVVKTSAFSNGKKAIAGMAALLAASVAILSQIGDFPDKAQTACETLGICANHTLATLPGTYSGWIKISVTLSNNSPKEITEPYKLTIDKVSGKGAITGSMFTDGITTDIIGQANKSLIHFELVKRGVARGIPFRLDLYFSGSIEESAIRGTCSMSSMELAKIAGQRGLVHNARHLNFINDAGMHWTLRRGVAGVARLQLFFSGSRQI